MLSRITAVRAGFLEEVAYERDLEIPAGLGQVRQKN